MANSTTTRPPRNKALPPSHPPLGHSPTLTLQPSTISGPLPFLNPTKAQFRPSAHPTIHFKWTSRNNRKGRHAVVLTHPQPTSTPRPTPPPPTHDTPAAPAAPSPRPTSSPRSIARSIARMLTHYPLHDISFDVALVFTLGSAIWVANAFFAWLPLARPGSVSAAETLYGGGITAFVGATVFEAGSVMLVLEALNEDRAGCFGGAVARAVGVAGEGGGMCTHHHHHQAKEGRLSEKRGAVSKEDDADKSATWTWCPSTRDLRTHYLRSLGFLASLAQLLGATIFWIAGLTSLPGIYPRLTHRAAIALYWTPQVVGGLGFILSGTLFMLETQARWWAPAPRTLGWWIGAWNLLGGVGFTLCPAFGYDASGWAQYQACLATFWGSWAFLIGSVVQWYESLEKYPVEVDRSGGLDGSGGDAGSLE